MPILLWARFLLLAALAGIVGGYVWADRRRRE
jgi:hypothetical protein